MRIRRNNTCFRAILLISLCANLWPLSSSADDGIKKVVLIAGPKSHGPVGNGIHDYPWSVKLLKVMLDHSTVRDQLRVEYHLDGMPRDLKTLDDADTIMVISDGRDGDLYQEAPHLSSKENLQAVQKQIDRGCGFLTFHFSTFTPDQYARQVLEWSGGYFDWESDGKKKWYSAITHKEADITLGTPEHPVLRGIKPFKMKEEFYFNLRFAPEAAGVVNAAQSPGEQLSPLFVVPALNGREPDGNVVAWAKQRANGGRGFGTTCGHFYANWERDEFRKLILNAIAWTAKVEVPKEGVEAKCFTHAEITKGLAGVEGTARSEIDDRPIRVLLIAGNDAHKWHNWQKTTPAIKAALETDPRIKVDVSLDIEDLAKGDISRNYDLILPNYVNWHDPKPLSDASKAAFMNFVQNGGGVLFVHFNASAFHFSLPMAAESDWPEYRKIALRVWNHQGKGDAQSGHDVFGLFKVDVTPIEHVITAGLKGFDVIDELYFKQDGRPVDPLITAKSKVTGRDEPLAFVGSYGKGRVFQTLLGHSEKTYDVYEPREMLRRAAAWAANRRVLKLRPEDDPVALAEPSQPAPAPTNTPKELKLAPGKFGQALDARATGVSIQPKPEQVSVPLTVECWARLEAKAGFNILIASEPKSSATHWELYSYAGSGVLSAYLPGCGGEYRTGVDIVDGQWHHVAMSLEAKRIRLFVDGKQHIDRPLPSEFAAGNVRSIAIGRLVEGGIGNVGLIDEVRIRRGAHIINAVPDKAPDVDDNTVGLWHFDEIIEKTKLKDESKLQSPATAVATVPPANVATTQSNGKPKPPAHWGKEKIGFDQWEGDWVDNRWKDSQIGRWLSSVVALPGGAGRKMTSIRVGDQQQATVCFDAENAQVRAIWTGGFLRFNPARFGIIGAPSPDGAIIYQTHEQPGWTSSKVKFQGLHTHGERVVLSYDIDGVKVHESPWIEEVLGATLVTRTIEIGPSDAPLELAMFDRSKRLDSNVAGDAWLMEDAGPISRCVGVRGWPEVVPVTTSIATGFRATFKIPAHTESRTFKLVYWSGAAGDKVGWEKLLAAVAVPQPSAEPVLRTLLKPGPAKWTAKIETELVIAPDDAPYVLDTFKLPFDNPYKSLLFTSGHDFLSNGDIVVCTVHGDVWRVRRAGLGPVTKGAAPLLRWQRIATGLHQPLGLVVVRGDSKNVTPNSQTPLDAVYVLGRDQITRLHDLNNDGETDFYECFSNIYPTSAGGHDYIACLERDSQGQFWFVHANLGIVRVSADGQKFEVISTGLRNPNGLGLGPDDMVTASPQEGDWTPASAIFVAKPGAHFGGGGPRVTDSRPLGFDPPAVWIPRRVDNSSGGQTWVTSDKWGSLHGHLLHFSFGQCSMMLGIRCDAPHETRSGERGHAIPTGLIEFPFRFDSGAMRGRFSPEDGQLYVTGLRGWTSAATTDGCLQRVRYTGQPIDLPVIAKAYPNGIAITFTERLDRESAENPGNYHVEQWNYLYSQAYGSPEYQVSNPKQEGRDEVRVRSATVIDDRTVFLEMKDVKPVNVLAVSYALKNRRTLYLTLNSLRTEKFDESKLVRRAPAAGLDEVQEAGLRPGLIARFAAVPPQQSVSGLGKAVGDVLTASRTGERGYADSRVDRMAATFVKAGSAPTPFLNSGPYVGRWEGYLRLQLKQTVTFSIEGKGTAKLFINDKEVTDDRSSRRQPNVLVAEQPATLNGGFNKLAIEYISPGDGSDSQFRLMWASSEFAREPVPPTVLFHNGDDAELIRSQQLRRGRSLFASLKCVACHAADSRLTLAADLMNDAPNLAGINQTHRQWTIDWIVNPSQVRPGSRMPHLNVTVAEAGDIAAWLATKATQLESNALTGNADQGSIAFEELGCITCHRLKADGVDEYSRRSLAHVKDKFLPGQLASFLKEPERFHPGSRMPNFQLDDLTAASLAAFIMTQTKSSERPAHTPGSPENGAKLFSERGCVQCHAVGDQPIRPRAELAPLLDLASSDGCLANGPHRRIDVPHYQLPLADHSALLRFLKTDFRSLGQASAGETAQTLVKELRCHSCHDRDGEISPRRVIISDESDRGLAPDAFPNLTWAGEKLRTDWMAHFIGEGQTDKHAHHTTSLRPWLKGRMPKFPAYASKLADGLAAEHGLNSTDDMSTIPDLKRAELGNALTQRTALDCRQCHAVGQQLAQGDDKTKIAPGINFALVRDRLRYDYYRSFILDPPRFDINTRMPKLAADGKKTKVTTILEGDAGQQFDAIWHFIGTAKF